MAKLMAMTATRSKWKRSLVGSSSEDETARCIRREHARNIRPARNRASYQTLHTLAVGFTVRCPGLQENASANSGMFTTTPLMR